MNEKILSDFETFEEFPNGILLVKKNTNLMYIIKGKELFITREFVDSVSNRNDSIIHCLSYYDVTNNEKILSIKLIKSLVDSKKYCLSQNLDIRIMPLSMILDLKEESKSYLNINDVKALTNFQEETKEKIK